ncbi:hypothetical protein [Streptomyces sodiiphilus]|uniref:hypothetical protein n=1 Tax=Streptomyces sodiiphilus TaxID=226217 RepID=UPI0031D647A6
MGTFFGSQRLVPRGIRLEDSDLEERCRVGSRNGFEAEVTVKLGWSDEMGQSTALHDPAFRLYEPLPAREAGFVTADGDRRHVEVVVFLRCESTDRHIMAQVSGEMLLSAQGTLGVREARALGSIAAGSASRMGEDHECAPEEMPSLKKLDLPQPVSQASSARSDFHSPSQATGTCASVKEERALLEVMRVETIRESAAGSSPIESCLLLAEEGREYWLNSWYGPYATEAVIGRGTTSFMMAWKDHAVAERHSSVMRAWGVGECPTPYDTARFALRAGTSDSPEASYTEVELEAQRKLLNVFAAESAERHGCGELSLP